MSLEAPEGSAPEARGEPARGIGAAGVALRLGGGLLVLALVGMLGVGALLSALIGALMAEEPQTRTVTRPTPSVVVAIRDLSRLETTRFHMERVIEMHQRQRRLLDLVEAEDSILLVAAGDVSAGVDLGALEEGDVQVQWETRQAQLTLPAAEIFSSRLDSERTFVHRRETDLLAERDERLESSARREAERSIHEAALEAGILERAQENAERTVRGLVTSLGYEEVEIRFRAP